MALLFPKQPAEGDLFSSGAKKYIYQSGGWRIYINNAPQTDLYTPWTSLKDKPRVVAELESELAILNMKSKKVLTGSFTGKLKQLDATARWYAPSDVKLLRAWCSVGDVSASPVVVSIKVNDISLLELTLAANSNISTPVDIENVVLGNLTDYITCSIKNAVGGSNLTIYIEYEVL